jgi:hypothetical protein
LILAAWGCGGGQSDSAGRAPSADTADSLVITVPGRDGSSVFEVTSADHQLRYTESPMGVFIKGIDGVIAADGYAWVYTVNDTAGSLACDRRMTREGDTIKWHFRKY